MKIVIINQKGGVGKTTVCINLSYALTQLTKKILLIDLDPQAHTSVIYHKTYKLPPSILKEKLKAEISIKDLLLNKRENIHNAVYDAFVNNQKIQNLKIIPSNIHLAAIAEQITAKIHREKLLDTQIDKIKNQYDYMIIDCPPSLNVLTVNAIYTADLIIIPTIYAKYSLDGIADLFLTISEVKENEKYHYRILRNYLDSRNKQSNQFIDEQLEPFKKNLLKTIIRKCESINQAQMNEETIFDFDPTSKGADDFNLLSKEIIDYYA
jgi:chromosome partitioning protein